MGPALATWAVAKEWQLTEGVDPKLNMRCWPDARGRDLGLRPCSASRRRTTSGRGRAHSERLVGGWLAPPIPVDACP